MTNILRKISVLIFCILAFCQIVSAQTNLFTTANIAATSFSPAPSYGTASNLYDGNTSTYVYWSVSSNITVKMKQATKIGYYEIAAYSSSSYSPQSVTLSASNDSVNWTVLDNNRPGNQTTIAAVLSNTASYLYYKFTLNGVGAYGLTVISELRGYASTPPPATPTLTAKAGTVGTTVTLSWNATTQANVSAFSGYDIQRSLDGTNFTFLTSVAAPTITFSDTTTVQNTAYWYRVRARNDTLFSSYSTAVKVTTVKDSLTAIPVLKATARSGKIVPLSWTYTINTKGTYQLYKSTDSINYNLIATLDKSIQSYSDTLSDTTKTYFYKVRGLNYTSTSPYSNVVKVSDSLLTAPVISASAGAIGSIANVSWTYATTSPTYQFNLERSIDSTTFSKIATLPKTTLTYADSSLNTATKYFYRVTATNSLGNSPYSNIVRVITVNDTLKNAPVLTATSTTGTQAQLSWTYSFSTPTAGGYEIQQSTDSLNFTSLGKVDKSVTSFTVQSLYLNTKYWFRVRAYNYIGNSTYSNVPSIITNNIYATADITYDGGKLFVNAENTTSGVTSPNNAEGSSHLIDHDITTKFLVFTAQLTGTLNCIYRPTGTYIVTSYGVGTANDNPPRDPQAWTFAGSNDSTTWVTLDTRTGQFGGTTPRNTFFYFNIANPGTVSYKYYRISFTANNGATDGVRFQIAEWPIYGTPTSAPNLPQNLKVTDSTTTSLSLTWTEDRSDTSKHITNFLLQRGLDQLNFTTVNSNIPSATTSYTDQGLLDSATYYYRIQAVDSTKSTYTGFSNITKGTTKVATGGVPLIPLLSLGIVTDSTVGLQWVNRAWNATGFKIERSTDSIHFTQIDSVAGNVTTYTNYPVWSAYRYYYRIRSYNSNGASAYSNIVTTITTGYNRPPETTVPIIYRTVCVGAGTYNYSFSGIVPGPDFESSQTLRVTSVVSDTGSAKLFSGFGFDSVIDNGIVNYSFTTNNTVKDGDSATILVTVKDNGGTYFAGVDSLVIPVTIYFNALNITVTADKDINNVPRYAMVTLTAQSTAPDATTYTWSSDHPEDIVGSNDLLILQVRPFQTETITLTATTTQNCTAATTIILKPQDSLVVSNVLTPNGDGINDKWIVYGIQNLLNNNVKIIDRSGVVVFSQKNYNNSWDGKYNGSYLPEGAYYYVVEYDVPSANGATVKKQAKGVLTIIRER